ncbi:hypothetical protein C0993_004158 [Termitomyces sp. T159_Od127]|nr:hypothetical protein C0993_004158 [Termitomyces sp. T159_Od127]
MILPDITIVANSFNPLHHSGGSSPYFNAPSQDGIATSTPSNCKVDQAAYILRHGSRYPEPGSFTGWQALFAKFQNASYTATGPLAFIPSWVPPVDDIPHEPLFLSSTGAREAFSLGVDLRKRYALTRGGQNLTVWAASQQRCVDTASFFLRGYLSQGDYLTTPNENRGSIITLADSVNFTFADSLTPSAACPAYSGPASAGATSASNFRAMYQPKIAERLNRFLDGLTLDPTDIGVMQDLCGFQAEINGDTRFCDVFEDSEWLDYEYALDLNYYYGSGPGNPIAATTGFPWVKIITDLFNTGPGTTTSGGNFTPPALIMGFTVGNTFFPPPSLRLRPNPDQHDNNLPPVVAALGLWNTSTDKNVYPLSPTKPNTKRQFRSSFLVTFHGHVALERLACTPNGPATTVKHVANQFPSSGPTESYVRIRSFADSGSLFRQINNAPVAIPGCVSGPGNSCPLDEFTAYVQQRGVASGDYVKTCGLENVSNATSVVSFLTTEPDPSTVQLVSI